MLTAACCGCIGSSKSRYLLCHRPNTLTLSCTLPCQSLRELSWQNYPFNFGLKCELNMFLWYSCLNVIGSFEGLEVYIFFSEEWKPYAALSKLTSQTEKSSTFFPCSLITCKCMRSESWLLNPLVTPVCLWVCGWWRRSGGAGGQSRLAESHMLRNRFSSSCLEPAAVHPSAAPLNILYLLLTRTMCTVCLSCLGRIYDLFVFPASEMGANESLMLYCNILIQCW